MSNLKLINMRDVEVEPICWLWYPFISYGKVTIIQGDRGKNNACASNYCTAHQRRKHN